jgi:hypothetical protein
VVIEIGLFGPAGARAAVSSADFSVRINGKKPLPTQPFGLVAGSVKDPEWEPPEAAESKSKTKLSSGGQGEQGGGSTPPPPPKPPIATQREWAQRVQKAALPEGDRPLPEAGLIFFLYRGKVQNIDSIELTYAGATGKVTLALQP